MPLSDVTTPSEAPVGSFARYDNLWVEVWLKFNLHRGFNSSCIEKIEVLCNINYSSNGAGGWLCPVLTRVDVTHETQSVIYSNISTSRCAL